MQPNLDVTHEHKYPDWKSHSVSDSGYSADEEDLQSTLRVVRSPTKVSGVNLSDRYIVRPRKLANRLSLKKKPNDIKRSCEYRLRPRPAQKELTPLKIRGKRRPSSEIHPARRRPSMTCVSQ